MRTLPAERFDLSVWSQATVNIDYHVEFDRSFYSVPYQLAQQKVEVRATPTTVEIFHLGTRVASFVRAAKSYTPVTNPEHRPKAHRAHLDGHPRASSTGPKPSAGTRCRWSRVSWRHTRIRK